MRHRHKIGDAVKSQFRAQWTGIVIARDELLYTVALMVDSAGHPQPKRIVTKIHHDWLKSVVLDDSKIRKDWL